MHRCLTCDTKFDDDEMDECPACDTPVISKTCSECQGVYDPTFYGEDNCPYCGG
jgi:rRNA maturation endonuclease Nob1